MNTEPALPADASGTLALRFLRRSFEAAVGLGVRWKARFVMRVRAGKELQTMATKSDLNAASEALVAMPLPDMLAGMGLAVARANAEMAKNPGPNGTVMTVQSATIDLNIAISVDTTTTTSAGGSLALKAFSVNASYARTFGFKEEASSRIQMTLAITPPQPAAA